MFPERFTILNSDDGVFTDHSFLAQDYTTDSFEQVLVAAEDYMYIGYRKPFSSYYILFDTANTNAASLTQEYYNGTAWVEMDINDNTSGMTQNGHAVWDIPISSNGQLLWEEIEVNSTELYWIRVKPSADQSASTSIKGLSILFSDDLDLIEEKSTIVSKFRNGGNWADKHQAAVKEIIQKLRNRGYAKTNSNSLLKDITKFDIHNFDQVRQASKFLVMSKIYLQEISDEAEDKFFLLGKEYERRYEDAFNIFYLSLDTDDDGVVDTNETLRLTAMDIVRR